VFALAAYTLSVLLKVPFSKEKRQYMSQTAAELESKVSQGGAMPFPPSHYVLKPDMMEKMKYPLPKQEQGSPAELPEGFVQTQPSQDQGGELSASIAAQTPPPLPPQANTHQS